MLLPKSTYFLRSAKHLMFFKKRDFGLPKAQPNITRIHLILKTSISPSTFTLSSPSLFPLPDRMQMPGELRSKQRCDKKGQHEIVRDLVTLLTYLHSKKVERKNLITSSRHQSHMKAKENLNNKDITRPWLRNKSN